VHDPLGSWAAAIAIRLGIHPSVVTLTGLVPAVTASVVVILTASHAEGVWLPGLLALVGWQLAYVLDCADGQVARATGKCSDSGARLDLLVDFTRESSIICALVAVIARWSDPPVVLLAVFSTLWLANLLVAVLARTNDTERQVAGRRGTNAVVGPVRDSGFLLPLVGGWLLISPRNVIIPVAAVTVMNAAFLLTGTARESWLSIRGTQ
jgi:phosphatidylglycerophosphate synthase